MIRYDKRMLRIEICAHDSTHKVKVEAQECTVQGRRSS